MTDQPPTTTDIHLQVATAAVPGPDGAPWVLLELRYGLTVVQILLPESLAEKAVIALPEQLRQGVAAARRARVGLILPGQPGDGWPYEPRPPGSGPPPAPPNGAMAPGRARG